MNNDIGAGLRQARVERGMSLRGLAAASGISASLLSQVETGKSQPSVSTLYLLVTELGISLDELLGIEGKTAPALSAVPQERSDAEPAARAGAAVVQRACDNPVMELADGVRWERLATGGAADIEALLVTYEPGAASSTDRKLMRHNGTEYAVLLSGELTLLLDFDRHQISAGDSLCFESSRPHLYVNQGDEPARGVWFVAGGHALDHTTEWVTSQIGAVPPAARPANAVEALALVSGSTTRLSARVHDDGLARDNDQ